MRGFFGLRRQMAASVRFCRRRFGRRTSGLRRLVALDGLIHLAAMYGRVSGSRDSHLHLVAGNTEEMNSDSISNYDFFSRLS